MSKLIILIGDGAFGGHCAKCDWNCYTEYGHWFVVLLSFCQLFFTFTDFYEEMFSLVESLTTSHISEKMWQVLPILYEMFKSNGIDFFTGKKHSANICY
jgi:hypothetical protein